MKQLFEVRASNTKGSVVYKTLQKAEDFVQAINIVKNNAKNIGKASWIATVVTWAKKYKHKDN